MNKEIEIPKGYEARIEGNKVIIVPIDSEDERIRKSIMSIISQYARMCEKEGDPCEASLIDDALAYLERQKEHLSVPDKFSGLKSLMLQYLQSAANRKDDTEIESDTDLWGRKILDYVWKHDEKQKEQNLIPKFKVGDRIYDKKDSYNRNVIREVGKDYYINAFAQKMDMAYTDANFEFIEHLDDDPIDSNPAEWSEDERIRKEIIAFLKHYHTGEGDSVIYDDAWIAYLEKQKEQDKIPLLRKCLRLATAHISELIEENYSLKESAEWSEEDDAIHTRVLGVLGKAIMGVLPTRPSQEDIEWFKSLPERFNLQPKQEWSKEDERLLNVIIDILDKEEHNGHLMRGDLKACIKLLKSLRPQHITYALDAPLGYDKDMNPIYPPINHWKPTERQIAALEWQIKNTYDGSWQRKESESLYNDLKKL